MSGNPRAEQRELTLCSPAKLNLFLQVVRRRPDGYHDLASLFQTISLADHLTVGLADTDSLTCDDAVIPTDHSNLILKAADLFRNKTELQNHFCFHLEKKIPIQAGLGGGSSNAATALWAMNQLCGTPATPQQLMTWSVEIGSDIPFFFSQGTAYCTGRGEHVRQLPALPSKSLSLIKPDAGLSTAQVFSQVDVGALPPRNPKKSLEGFLEGRGAPFNDLEPAAFAAMPELATLKQALVDAGCNQPLITGTGSALFCTGEIPASVLGQKYRVDHINRHPDSWYKVR